jgi:Fur family ferric uptake transcriptional regulator
MSEEQIKPWEIFKEHLAKEGLRVTNQRQAIFDVIFAAESHFTAEDLLTLSRERDSSISRATIYRTLPLLVDCELVREIDVGKDYKYYMAVKCEAVFKAQVICTDCDQIFEVDAPFMEWYGKTVSEKLGLEVSSQRLQVHGSCIAKKEGKRCTKFAS